MFFQRMHGCTLRIHGFNSTDSRYGCTDAPKLNTLRIHGCTKIQLHAKKWNFHGKSPFQEMDYPREKSIPRNGFSTGKVHSGKWISNGKSPFPEMDFLWEKSIQRNAFSIRCGKLVNTSLSWRLHDHRPTDSRIHQSTSGFTDSPKY